MGIFSRLFGGQFAEYVEQAQENGATLVDVREPHEFARGHVKGATNVPLSDFDRASKKLKAKNAPVYVYCASGARSRNAARALQTMGFSDVTNIGGIGFYRGEIVVGDK